MRRIRAALLGLISLAALPMPLTQAQGVGNPSSPGGNASGTAVMAPTQEMLGTASYSGSAPVGPFGGYLYFRKDIGQGVGYNEGFSTVGWFQPVQVSEHGMAFGQGQFFITDDGQFGGNLGGGYRHYFPSIDRLFGAYAFYDGDESTYDNGFDQFGFGVETLGRRWDTRANVYAPLTKKTRFLGPAAPFAAPAFVQHNLLFNGSAYFEKAMPGADIEFGLPILDPSGLGRLRAYFGAYVYDSEDKNPAGVRARLETHLNQYFTIGAAFLHDDVHGGQATLAVDIRAWSKRLPPITNYRPTQEPKLYLPPVRQYRVATHTFIDEFTAFALGDDGEPLDFVWVDNSNSGGDGTFEDPFHDMPSSAPGADYILVRRGASSTGNPVLGGIVLEDDQIMVGEGVQFAINIAGTKFGAGALGGSIDIDTLVPGWDTDGNQPFLRNPVGSAITLADNNQVGSLHIISSSGDGISGTGIRNFHLFNLNIGHTNGAFGNNGAGIDLTNVSGLGLIQNVSLFNNNAGGLIVDNTSTAPLQLFVASDPSVDPNATGGAVALSLTANNSDIAAEISGFLANGSGTGMYLEAANSGSLDVIAGQSEFNNTTSGDGIQIVAASGATVFADFVDVSADGADRHGLNVDVNNALFVGTVDATPGGNSSFSGATQDGVHLTATNAANPGNLLSLTQTLVNGNGGDGMHVDLTGNSTFGVQFVDGQLVSNGGDAVDATLDVVSTLSLFVDPSLLADSGANSFRFELFNASFLDATFLDSTLSGSGQFGIPGEGNGVLGILDSAGGGGSVANLNFGDTVIDDSGENGIRLDLNDFSTVNVDFNRVTISNSDRHGLVANVLNGSTLAGTIFDGEILDNGQDLLFNQRNGVELIVDDAMVDLALETRIANTLGVTTQEHGVHFEVTNGSIVTLDGLGASIASNSGDGVQGVVSDSFAFLLFEGVNLNGDSGVNLVAEDGATVFLEVDSGARENGLDGVRALATGTNTSLTFFALALGAEDNGLRGFDLTVEDGALLDASIFSSFGSGNGVDGFRLTANDAGTIARLNMLGTNAFDNNGANGVQINATDVAEIDAIVAGSASGNFGDGVQFNITNVTESSLASPIAARVGVVGPGTIANNSGSGVEFNINGSTINSLAGDVGLVVDGLTIDSNLVAGVQVNVSNSTIADNSSLLVPTFLISNNSIDGNFFGAGVDINLNTVTVPSSEIAIVDNLSISGNGTDGVVVDFDNINGGTVLDGLMISNNFAIDANDGDGIDLVNVSGDTLLTNLEISDNGVNDNEEIGINLTNAAMTGAQVNDNTITGNEFGGVFVGGTGPKQITFDGNTIDANNGDGLRIVNNGQIGANAYDITATNNTITNNADRGVNILNQGTADSTIDFSFNTITDNIREAFYVVNTASTTQLAGFGAPLLSNGALNAIPRLLLTVENNTITDNGASAAQTALGHGGLVIRVGTSDAPTSHTDPGGFASTGGPLAPTPSRGGVIAFVRTNTFDENVGADVFIHSFVSTVTPATTTGSFGAGTLTTFQADALARLDMVFSGNTGDEALVTNLGAFYSNDEPNFKSRTNAPPDAGAAGPFTSGTRRRNAQRLASRAAPFDAPVGTFDAFLYPGVGGSTFRVSAGSNTNGFGAGNNFGTTVPFGTPITGELPFGWDLWP